MSQKLRWAKQAPKREMFRFFEFLSVIHFQNQRNKNLSLQLYREISFRPSYIEH